jgi:hypothetical protein
LRSSRRIIRWRAATGFTAAQPQFVAGCCEMFRALDAKAAVLGVYPGTGDASFAIKAEPDWTALWAVTPALPPQWYREIARHAGVHIYDEANDLLEANRSFLVVTAANSGMHTIALPRPTDVYDQLDGRLVARSADHLEIATQLGETRLFRLVSSAFGAE